MRDVSRRGIAAGRSGLGLLLLALLFALLLALLIAAGVGCSHDEPRRPNILLVIVDTLRADHVGSYGYSRDTTPAMDLFAQGAVRFERAYATAPWTQPSVASILTGLEPGRHGLRSFGALPSEVVTLAEQLRDHGYETAAIVSHVLLARRFGFDQGFATFLVASALPAHERISTEAVTRNALTLLESFAKRSPSREPFFLLVHYFDPHYRYRAHDDADFAAPSAGRLGGGEEIDVLRDLMKDASDEEIGFVVDLYDEEIKHTDAGVGRLLAALTRMGLDPNTLVVITSDHGEELLERGWLGHTRTLYEELVRVPLIVRPPGESRPGRVVDRPVSLTALAATMLDFAEVPEAVTGLRAADSLRPLLVVPSTVPSTVPVTVPPQCPPQCRPSSSRSTSGARVRRRGRGTSARTRSRRRSYSVT